MNLDICPRDEEKVIEKVKDHIKRHKVAYSCGVTAVVTAGITCFIMRSNASQHIEGGISVLANRGISVIADRSVVGNVSLISSRRQGAPSWVVRCIETNQIFTSQLKTANEMDLPASEISKHLNGIMDNVRGYHFERICLAA